MNYKYLKRAIVSARSLTKEVRIDPKLVAQLCGSLQDRFREGASSVKLTRQIRRVRGQYGTPPLSFVLSFVRD